MRVPAVHSAVAAFLFLFAAAAFAQSTVTLQQDLNAYGGTTDTFIASFGPSTNYGSWDNLNMERETQQSILIRFAIFAAEGGPVPDNATITSATLSLYKFLGPTATIKASRLKRSWNEMQATWSVAATGAAWGTAGAFGASDVEATADAQASVGDATGCFNQDGGPTCWLNLNVTSGVQAFKSGTPNYGWKLSYVSGGDASAQKEFKSSEHPTHPTLRPKLAVTYCAPPTAQLSPTPTSGPKPLNVAFNASASTNGSSPITNLRLQFGDGTPDANWSDKSQAQQHTYAVEGDFTATLTATNACGTSAPVARTITVTTGGTAVGPTAQFTATQRPESLTVDFNASGSTQGSAPITNLSLAFGDGTNWSWTDKNQPQPHTYKQAGTYDATLTVTDANKLSHSITKPVTVNPISSTPIDQADILFRPRAGLPFAQQSSDLGGHMHVYDDPVEPFNQVPESGIKGNDGRVRFGKKANPTNTSQQVFEFLVAPNDPETNDGRRGEFKGPNAVGWDEVYWTAFRAYVYDWGTGGENDDASFVMQLHGNGTWEEGGLGGPVFSIWEWESRKFRIVVLNATASGEREKWFYPPLTQEAIDIPFGQWTEFVFKFRRSIDNGLLQVWMNGTQILNRNHALGRCCLDNYPKFGYYSWTFAGFDQSGQDRRVLLHSPVLIHDPTGTKYTLTDVQTFLDLYP